MTRVPDVPARGAPQDVQAPTQTSDANTQLPADPGQVPTGRTPSDTVGRGGTATTAPNTTPLGQSGNVTPQQIDDLGTLLRGTGAIRGQSSQQGDVDFKVGDGGTFTLPAEGDADKFGALGNVFSGDDVALQGQLVVAMSGYTAAGRTTQQSAEGNLFNPPLSPDARTSFFSGVTGDVVNWNGSYSPGAQRSFQNLAAHGLTEDVNSLVQWVLREAYLDVTENLKMYAEKVRYFNQQKKAIREYLTELREYNANFLQKAREAGFADFNSPEAQQWAQQYFMTQGGMDSANATIWETAYVDSVDNCLTRADQLIHDKFGVNLPPELRQRLQAALESKDPAQMNAAFREVAGYVAYLGDCNVRGGEFGAGDGYDDAHHIDDHPSWNDYQHYLSDDNNKNKQARTNLATGDVRILEAAFGLPEGILGGSSSFEDICNAAMSPIGDAWRNHITHGQFQTSKDIMDEIYREGPNSEAAIRIFGSSEAAMTAMYGEEYMADTPEGQMRRELGMPAEVPPPGVYSHEQLEAEIKKWEEKLSSVGDDAQLANVDLQNWLQKQQQVVQMMSNIAKMTHDTMMAIIRKIGG